MQWATRRGGRRPNDIKAGIGSTRAVKSAQEKEQPAAAAAVLWAAAAAARAWSASIRENAACAARSAAWSAENGANEAVMRAAEDCGRVPDAEGRPGADAMGRVTAALRRAADMMNAAAEAHGRSSRLCGEAAAEAARAYRAFRRAGDAESAGIHRSTAARSRRGARDAAGLAAKAAEAAGDHLSYAGRLEACAAEWSSREGGRGRAIDMRMLSLALSDTREETKHKCLESAMTAKQAAELERATANVRRAAAAAARTTAGEAAMAEAAAAEEDGDRGGGDPNAERAAAAWKRAMAAANRADAAHPAAAAAAGG